MNWRESDMDTSAAERIAKRFVGLPVEQRRQILDKMRETGQSFRLLPIARTRHEQAHIPLSYAQQRMLFLWQLEPGNIAYNVPLAVRLEGPLDRAALAQALDLLLQRHETLRTRFVSTDGEFHQEILQHAQTTLEFTHAEPADIEALVRAELQTPFDLLGGAPLRVRLFQLAETEHVLTLCLHHVVSDGWSGELLIREFVQLYQAQVTGRDAQLPTLAVQYADYAIWQRAWLEAGEGERQLEYWKRQLGDEHPLLELPLDHARPQQPSYRGATLRFEVPDALSAQLKTLARHNGQTLFMLTLAALAVVLSRFSGQADIRIGAPNAGRTRSELEGLIGFFVNTQVLRVQVDERQTFAGLLEQVKDVVTGAQSHQELPFEHLVDALAPERNLGHNPLFQFKINQHVYSAEQTDVSRERLAGLSVSGFSTATADARFDLAFDFSDIPSGLRGYFTYATDLFEAATVERVAASFHEILAAMAAHANERIADHPLRSPTVIEHQTGFAGQNFLDLWQQGLSAGRGKVAVRAGQQTLDFEQLEQRSNQLARYLQAQGVGAAMTVALCQERTPEWVISLLAVLKLGAVYLPLDTRQPAERLRQLTKDSAAVLVIHAAGDQQAASLGVCPMLAYDDSLWSEVDDSPLGVEVAAGQPAYIIYTSGSTGQPKGVVISHGALANYLQGVLQRLALDADASMAMVSTVAADLGHTLLFGALASGRTLHLLSHEQAFDPDGFAAYMAEHQVQVLKIVPSHLQGLLQAAAPADVLPGQLLILGGESSSWALIEQVRALKPGCRILNHYGPTESTVGILTHEVGEKLAAWRSVPVGQPLANARARVLDAWLNPVAEGVAGELYLGGRGLAQGYLNRAAMTAERFVPDPQADGERLYRTGDRARLAGNVLEYLGRADDQVKIRGYRVEPGEVGRTLQTLDDVAEAVVLAQPLDSDDSRLQLVAYCVAAAGKVLNVESLREQLAARLPEYLLPAQILLLERLPLTANGKLDKRALPKPGAVTQRYTAPVGETEEILASVWADVLKLERVGTTDNFFELGGDSILSLQIIARAKRQGLKLSPKQLFEKQTIAQLATVAKLIQKKPAAAVEQVGGSLPLLPIQARFFELEIPERQHWNQSVMLKPGTLLQAAPLHAALNALIEQHDALRLGFSQHDGQWQASFNPLKTQDVLWTHELDTAERLTELADEAQRSLDLKNGPLLRAVLINLPEGDQRLLLVIHHLVVDGVSWRVLLEDLQQAYAAAVAGTALTLPVKTSSLKAWAERLQAYAGSDTLIAERDYWLQVAQGAEQPLPRDNPQGSQRNRDAAHAESRLSKDLTHKLLKVAPAAYRTQVNDLLLAALAEVLCQWSGQPSVLVQLEGHGREDLSDDLDLSRTVGWFSSLFPVRLTPQSEPGKSLCHIKEQLRAVPNKGIGYGVLRYLGEPAFARQMAALPQARVTFNYLGQFDGSFADKALLMPSADSTGVALSPDGPLGNWLGINGQVFDGQLQLNWTYSREVYRADTVETLASRYEQALTALIEHCLAGPQGATPSDFPLAALSQQQLDRLPIRLSAVEDIYPLAPMQQGMLFHSLFERQAGNYVNQLRVDVSGLDIPQFRRAWQDAVDAHEVLRSAFVSHGEQALQVVLRKAELSFVEIDAREHPAGWLDDWARTDREQGFDLAAAPLLRLALLRVDDRTHHLVYTSHHILMDGWSSSRLLGEGLQRYSGHAPVQQAGRYRDYIQWLQGQDAVVSEQFWTAQLAQLDEPTRLAQAFGAATGDAATGGAGYGDYLQLIDTEATRRLNEFAREQRVTLNTLVQSAWLLVLQRYTGQSSVTFGATVAGRPADLPGVEEQLGLFINTLPVIASPRPEQAVCDWVQQVQAKNLALREHEHTPLYEIQRWAGRSGEALFDNILVFENYPVSEALQQAPAGLSFCGLRNQEQAHYPLTLVVEAVDVLSVRFSYDRRHFSVEGVAQLASHFDHLLQTMSVSPSTALGELALPSSGSRTPEAFPTERCAHQLIESQAARRPQAIALSFEGQSLSYQQLNGRANRLAHELRELGVGPEVRVGLAVARGFEMIIGLLAILKAGGAYVPLDPDSPAERLSYLLEDSGIGLLLTQPRVQARLTIPAHIQCLDLSAERSGYSVDNLTNLTTADNLAYVIYTSGSTGKPKGTLLTQHNLMRLFAATNDWFRFDEQDVWTLFHSYAFDFSVWEIFGALLHGGRLVIVPRDVTRAPEDFHALLVQEKVTVLNQTPSAFRQLMPVACGSEAGLALRTVIFGGEALDVPGLRPWFERFGDRQPQLVNMYGITETTVHVSYRPLSLADTERAASPIGAAIPDLSWYVLDADFNPVAQGCSGELHIGHAGLARGYHQRAALTAERFVPDPFSQEGGRLYRTGDLARYRGDGLIDYAGRIDHQVKIRGFRIELGEIEARLKAHPEVREAVVLALDGQLVAYFCGSGPGGSGVDPQIWRDQLKTYLKQSLPDYMVPAHLILLDELPLTGNGKLDRKALPAPDASQSRVRYVAPQTELQRQLAAIWAEVLKVEQVGLDDNFFELGGHSLLAVQMLARVREQLQHEVSLKDLFERASLAAFSETVGQKTGESGLAQDELTKSLEALKRLSAEEIDNLIA
jgi:amino acid adenylation domain-containing protein/non-ribosomal peptide synthase protein (TIGR01720 family)